MSTLIIALPLSSGDTTTRYEHVLTPEGQSIAVHATSTANLLPDASRGADETVAVVPAEALSWHRVELPKGVGAGSPRLRPVLQSLLEDRLLDDPQDLHLACEPSAAADRPIWIAACDKAWLSQHLQRLEAARRPVTRIVPEFAPHSGALRLQILGEADRAQMLLSGSDVAGGVVRLPLNTSTLAAIAGPDGLPERSELLAEPAVAALAEERLQRPVEIQQRTQRLLIATQTPWDLAQFDLANTSRTRTLKRLLGAGQALLRAPQWRAARWGALLLLVANLIGLNAWAWKEQASWQSRRSAIDSTLTPNLPRRQSRGGRAGADGPGSGHIAPGHGSAFGKRPGGDPVCRRRRVAAGKGALGHRIFRWRGPAEGAQPRPRRTGCHHSKTPPHGLRRPDGR
jgi:general secretion pathway protein L